MLVIGTGALIQLHLLVNCFRHQQRKAEVKSSVIKSGLSCNCSILKAVNGSILQVTSSGVISPIVAPLDLYLSIRATDLFLDY